MRAEAQAAIRALEEASGVPVLVTNDPSLRTMATIKPAKNGGDEVDVPPPKWKSEPTLCRVAISHGLLDFPDRHH